MVQNKLSDSLRTKQYSPPSSFFMSSCYEHFTMRFSVAKNQQFTVTKQTEPTTASSQFICCGQENTIHFYSIDISAFSTFENTFDTVILTMGKVFPVNRVLFRHSSRHCSSISLTSVFMKTVNTPLQSTNTLQTCRWKVREPPSMKVERNHSKLLLISTSKEPRRNYIGVKHGCF